MSRMASLKDTLNVDEFDNENWCSDQEIEK